MKTDDICKEAYYLWESQGRPQGRDQEFWFQAEMLLRSRLVPQGKPDSPVQPKRAGKATAPVTKAAVKATNGAKTAGAKTAKGTRKAKA